MHRLDRLARGYKIRASEQKREKLTGPAENFVTPECGRIEQMLHQGIVSPEPHPIHHPPLSFLFQLIGGTLREISGVLKNISGIVC